MNDMKELMTSLVTVQAAGIKAGLQAGDMERERLERELRESLHLLSRLLPLAAKHINNEPHFKDDEEAEARARTLLAKHGRLPT